ncbi:MAG: hypothetical protein JNM72_12330 [Deltaproteobacteria bacterium]|jgi:hypothetical protein|nr:hypothetical protein [Deltaproteobacteria bacterium]
MDLSRLALMGLLSAAVACEGAETTSPPPVGGAAPAASTPAAPAAAPAAAAPVADSMGAPPTGTASYTDVHECAGRNSCKGLGGCKVTAESLAALAKAAGVDMAQAGSPHDCAGQNACKGLGGCAVDEAKFASLKAAQAGGAAPAAHGHGPHDGHGH